MYQKNYRRYAKIFTCKAVLMYTNIDVKHSTNILKKWLTEFKEKIPEDIPTKLLTSVIEIIMKNNIFTFGDSFWLQN